MSRAVRFDKYRGIDVLRVVEVDRPVPGPRQVLVDRGFGLDSWSLPVVAASRASRMTDCGLHGIFGVG